MTLCHYNNGNDYGCDYNYFDQFEIEEILVLLWE